jgi:hypothetical protein
MGSQNRNLPHRPIQYNLFGIIQVSFKNPLQITLFKCFFFVPAIIYFKAAAVMTLNGMWLIRCCSAVEVPRSDPKLSKS